MIYSFNSNPYKWVNELLFRQKKQNISLSFSIRVNMTSTVSLFFFIMEFSWDNSVCCVYIYTYIYIIYSAQETRLCRNIWWYRRGVILLQTAVYVQRTPTRTLALLKVSNEYFIFQDGLKSVYFSLQGLKSNDKAKDRSDIKRREWDMKCKTLPTIPRR